MAACTPLNVDEVLFIDIETSKDSQAFLAIGACLAARTGRWKAADPQAIPSVEALAQPAAWIGGHNILWHDLPFLKNGHLRPESPLGTLPVLDTLLLSPLAFPRNPYHRLGKDYKRVIQERNHPDEDAAGSRELLKDELAAFSQMDSGRLHLYASLFSAASAAGAAGYAGTARLFARLSGKAPERDPGKLLDLFAACTRGQGCPNQLRDAFLATRSEDFAGLAMLAAWLSVAGGTSIVPGWVRNRFEAVEQFQDRIRARPCGQPDCAWCASHHDARAHLQRIFGYGSFRPLQQGIVQAALARKSLIAILPTSGGKSLCFQLPALVRNEQTGELTVVISPLQALMLDQVRNFQKTGYTNADCICGLLTAVERGAALERVALGDTAILYISPEQLRNRRVKRALMQRRIGAWVFDEAHCISKWGHDFRPDYLYSIRAIGELAQAQRAATSVECFTATAKVDVIEDIRSQMERLSLDQPIAFHGGVERGNLTYQVASSEGRSKTEQIVDLLDRHLSCGGSCVVYCATTKNCDLVHKALQALGRWSSAVFYARLSVADKEDVLSRFMDGSVRIVCATNAFGMGIDKPDIRLVIHYDIPGSLENYIQEAGRAGRDQKPALCVLLYQERDVSLQYQLTTSAHVTRSDMQTILRCLARKQKLLAAPASSCLSRELTVTAEELLGNEVLDNEGTGQAGELRASKVRTAIAWLETAEFLERNDNHTDVFQGQPCVRSLPEGLAAMDRLDLGQRERIVWEAVLGYMLDHAGKDSAASNADDIATGLSGYLRPPVQPADIDARDVIRTLRSMADAGLILTHSSLAARLAVSGKSASRKILDRVGQLERALVGLMSQNAPEGDSGDEQRLSLRLVCTDLAAKTGQDVFPERVIWLLRSWRLDGKNGNPQSAASGRSAVEFRKVAQDIYSIKVQYSWRQLRAIIDRRLAFAGKVLEFLEKAALESQGSGASRTVFFTLEDLGKFLSSDMLLAHYASEKILSSPVGLGKFFSAGTQRALLFLAEQKAITLQNGLSIFRPAMTIVMNRRRQRDQFLRSDYEPLQEHYSRKIEQIHFVEAYAQKGLEDADRAQELVSDYFSLDEKGLTGKYFAEDPKILAVAATRSTRQRVVLALDNPVQQRIVTAGLRTNRLILAGPGAGKTRVIVHRAAYLELIAHVPASSILILTYNHNAAVQLRRRLKALLASEAPCPRVLTFHGLALRLMGRVLSADSFDTADFESILAQATALLNGAGTDTEDDARIQREELLGDIQFLLVDEYQDIDQAQYDLISAIAGRRLSDEQKKVHLMAVGDDDQAIYGFRHANVQFIRQFAEDYRAKLEYLTENYRASARLIEASNRLIAQNRDRMKVQYPIRINKARRLLAGGEPIECWTTAGLAEQAEACAQWIAEHLSAGQIDPGSTAILARSGLAHEALLRIRSALEKRHIACRFALPGMNGLPMAHIEEFQAFCEYIASRAEVSLSDSGIQEWIRSSLPKTQWRQWLEALVAELAEGWGPRAIPSEMVQRFFWEALHEYARQARLGSGVLLSTVHGVKGEEFETVVILDGNWNSALSGCDGRGREEERRLFYVAMTRAKTRLACFALQACPCQHMADAGLLPGKPCACSVQPAPLEHIEVLGYADYFLDWAGHLDAGHPVHQQLAKLPCGAALSLAASQAGVSILSGTAVIGRLSAKATERWIGRLACITRATVIAKAVRTREQVTDEKFASRICADRWIVPIIEIRWVEKPADAE